MARPKVGDQTWIRIYHDAIVDVFESEQSPDFYFKVQPKFGRAKYFYGESAWSDYQRYAADLIDSSHLYTL